MLSYRHPRTIEACEEMPPCMLRNIMYCTNRQGGAAAEEARHVRIDPDCKIWYDDKNTNTSFLIGRLRTKALVMAEIREIENQLRRNVGQGDGVIWFDLQTLEIIMRQLQQN